MTGSNEFYKKVKKKIPSFLGKNVGRRPRYDRNDSNARHQIGEIRGKRLLYVPTGIEGFEGRTGQGKCRRCWVESEGSESTVIYRAGTAKTIWKAKVFYYVFVFLRVFHTDETNFVFRFSKGFGYFRYFFFSFNVLRSFTR